MEQDQCENNVRVVELEGCVDIGDSLEVFPNVYIGRASIKRGKPSAHHNLLFDDKSISGLHVAIYKCQDTEDRLMMFNASKHGFIHYSFQDDEFKVIKSNKLVSLQSFDMIGLSIVSNFGDICNDDEVLGYDDFEEYRRKGRLWIRILTDYTDKLLVKVINEDGELDAYLSKSEVGSYFIDEDDELEEVVNDIVNSNIYSDHDLSPRLYEDERNLLLELCREKESMRCSSDSESNDESKLFEEDEGEEIESNCEEEEEEDEITIVDTFSMNECTPDKGNSCCKRSIYDIDELEYELMESDLKRRCLTQEITDLKSQLNEYEQRNHKLKMDGDKILREMKILRNRELQSQLETPKGQHNPGNLTGFMYGSILSTFALYVIGRLI